MQTDKVMNWEPGNEASALLRSLYRARAKKPIIAGLVISYLGMAFIPAEGESMFSADAIPVHFMILLFWACAYWYFGSKKFSPTRCSLVCSNPPVLVVDGWRTDNVKYQVIKEFDSEVVAKLDGYILEYITIPKSVLTEMDKALSPRGDGAE